MTLLANVYNTEEELDRFLSSQGVVAHTDHDESGAPDDDVVHDCINDAKGEIDLFCGQRYAEADLATSPTVNKWSKVLSALFVCELRGNSAPDSLQREADRVRELLQKVLDGTLTLPGIPFSSDLRPMFSNLTVDRRYVRSKIRTTRLNSSDAETKIRRHYAEEVVVTDG